MRQGGNHRRDLWQIRHQFRREICFLESSFRVYASLFRYEYAYL